MFHHKTSLVTFYGMVSVRLPAEEQAKCMYLVCVPLLSKVISQSKPVIPSLVPCLLLNLTVIYWLYCMHVLVHSFCRSSKYQPHACKFVYIARYFLILVYLLPLTNSVFLFLSIPHLIPNPTKFQFIGV